MNLNKFPIGVSCYRRPREMFQDDLSTGEEVAGGTGERWSVFAGVLVSTAINRVSDEESGLYLTVRAPSLRITASGQVRSLGNVVRDDTGLWGTPDS